MLEVSISGMKHFLSFQFLHIKIITSNGTKITKQLKPLHDLSGKNVTNPVYQTL